MIADLKPYSEMKDSGVLWLGEMPEHWEVMRGRQLFEIKKQIAGKLGYPVYSVTQAGLRVKDVDSGEGQVSQDYSKYQFVRPGEFAMNSMDLLTGGVGIARSLGVTSPDYRVFNIRNRNQSLEHYMLIVLRLLYQNRAFYAWGQGSAQLGRWRLPRKRFNEFQFPVPPFSEQVAIGDFVAHVDRRIRRYIRAKQKLIKLLEEQKHAIMRQAITRGLDPDVRLKPSGVEWLGDVPEHWHVKKLRTQFRRHGSGTTPSGDQHYGGGVPWVMTGDLNDGDIVKTKRTVTPAAVESIGGLRLFPSGSLLVAMYGATIGKTGVLAIDACTNQACCVLAEPLDSVSVGFLQTVVNLARSHLVEQSYGGGQPNINSEIVRSLRVPVPPRREQEQIVEAIAQTKIDAASDRAEREITLLREYQTRLIADIVTGKLDVREVASIIPNAADSVDEEDSSPDQGDETEQEFDALVEEGKP